MKRFIVGVIGLVVRTIRKFLKIYPKTTIGELEDRLKGMNKNDIIYHIVLTAAAINGSQPQLMPGYKKELRKNGKRKLIKTAITLHVALTKQLNGEIPKEYLTGMKGMRG